MLWEIAAAIMAGILVGLRFRVSVLVVAALATVALNLIAGAASVRSWDRVLLSTVVLMVALQGAYLAGLLLLSMWSKVKR